MCGGRFLLAKKEENVSYRQEKLKKVVFNKPYSFLGARLLLADE
jgi:hypothetical protein